MVLEGVDLKLTGNTGNGLEVASVGAVETFGGCPDGDSVIPVGAAVFSKNGGNGISLSMNSHAAFYNGRVTVNGNGGDRISVWNDVDVSLNDATVTGNSADDIAVSLGSRLGWGGNSTIGTVGCGEGVMTYNDAACP